MKEKISYQHPKILDSSAENVCHAIKVVENGGVAILPADTVYGIFARSDMHDTVERVYSIKKREKRKPFVIYTNAEKVEMIAYVNDIGRKFINQVWPKALSLILPKRPIISNWFTHNKDTIAVMTARNFIISSLVKNIKYPILGTTVNISGEPELKKGIDIIRFVDEVDVIIIDDTIPIYNKPSTMIDCTLNPPRIARLSSLTLRELQKIVPELQVDLSRKIS